MTISDLFELGDLGSTLLVSLARDVAIAVQKQQASPTEVGAIFENPLIMAIVDHRAFDCLLKDVQNCFSESDVTMRALYAEVAFSIVQHRGLENARDFLHLLIKYALETSQVHYARAYAEVGLETYQEGAPDDFLRDCNVALANALYASNHFLEAIPLYETALKHCQKAEEQPYTWRLYTNIIACNYFLDNHLACINLANKAIDIARKLKDNQSLSKSLGDRGNSQGSLAQIDNARISYEEALKAAEAAGDDKMRSDWLGNLGNIALVSGDSESAIALHKESLTISRQIRAKQGELMDLVNLSQALWQNGQWSEAISYLSEAITLAEKIGDQDTAKSAREALLNYHLQQGHYHIAYALDRLLRGESPDESVHPETKAAYNAIIPDLFKKVREIGDEFTALMRARNFEGARAFIDALMASNEPVGHFFNGMFLKAIGKSQEAVEAYEQALRFSLPKDFEGDIHNNLINAWQNVGNLEVPLKQYEHRVANDPYNPNLRMALGRIYQALNRFDEGIRELKELLRLDSSHYIGLYNLCVVLFNAGNENLHSDWTAAQSYYDECSQYLEKLIGLSLEKRAVSLYVAGEMLVKMATSSHMSNLPIGGKISGQDLVWLIRGVIYLERSVELDPSRNDSSRELQRAHFLLKQFSQPLTGGSPLLDTSEAGTIALRMGDIEKAKEFFQLAIDQQPTPKDPKPFFQLGKLHATSTERQDLDKAAMLLKQALELSPENVDYQGALRQIEQRRTEMEKDG